MDTVPLSGRGLDPGAQALPPQPPTNAPEAQETTPAEQADADPYAAPLDNLRALLASLAGIAEQEAKRLTAVAQRFDHWGEHVAAVAGEWSELGNLARGLAQEYSVIDRIDLPELPERGQDHG